MLSAILRLTCDFVRSKVHARSDVVETLLDLGARVDHLTHTGVSSLVAAYRLAQGHDTSEFVEGMSDENVAMIAAATDGREATVDDVKETSASNNEAPSQQVLFYSTLS